MRGQNLLELVAAFFEEDYTIILYHFCYFERIDKSSISKYNLERSFSTFSSKKCHVFFSTNIMFRYSIGK